MKRCTKCGVEKPLEDFWGDRSRKDGKATRCIPCFREINRASQARHREKRLAARKRYREQNAEKLSAAWKEWYEANREARLEYVREWNRKFPEKKRAARDPEMNYEYVRRRRAKKAGVESDDHTRQEIYERDGGICMNCGIALAPDDPWEVDHIVPVDLGGPGIRANVQLLCQGCNRRKWTKLEGQIHFAA